MRLWLVLLLAIVFGGTVGLGMTWLELGRVVENFQSVSQGNSTNPSTALPISDHRQPKLVVEGGPKFDFGTMPFGATAHQRFVIRNEGEKALTVDFDHPSCGKCIETTFTSATVEPGSKCEVIVTYHARKEGPQFEESAALRTNDPQIPMVILSLVGVITKPVRIIPASLSFGAIPASEGVTASVVVLGYHFGEISLLGHEFSNKDLDASFEFTTKPLTNAQVKEKDEHATCGVEVTIKGKPGLPLGPFTDSMVLKVKADAEHKLDLPLAGEVVGDITVIGKNYTSERGILALGLMKQGEGKTGSLFLLVKGPNRNDVKITLGEVTPADALKVQIGEGSPLGKAIRIPVTIEVPKSAPAQTHMGDARGEMGKITLETTHPTVKQIPIQVRFVIE